MAKNKEEKTNVVRILEAAGIPCTAYEVPLPKGKVPDASPPPACWASLWSRYSRPWLPRAPRGNTSCMSSPWPRPWIEKGRPPPG